MTPTREPVLVVDDDEETRLFLRGVLRNVGLDVLLAEDGGKALELLRETSASVILLDLKMDHVDGAEFMRRRRRLRIAEKTPIVLITGGTAPVDTEGLGPALVLRKPFNVEELLTVVRTFAS